MMDLLDRLLRTEILHMLERLGVKNLIEGDVLGWEKTLKRE
jgi:hypothetical protein